MTVKQQFQLLKSTLGLSDLEELQSEFDNYLQEQNDDNTLANTIAESRFSDGLKCPHSESKEVIKHGKVRVNNDFIAKNVKELSELLLELFLKTANFLCTSGRNILSKGGETMIQIINEENKNMKRKSASLALKLTAFILGVVCGMEIVLFLLNTFA